MAMNGIIHLAHIQGLKKRRNLLPDPVESKPFHLESKPFHPEEMRKEYSQEDSNIEENDD
jgi:hypothetical protein